MHYETVLRYGPIKRDHALSVQDQRRIRGANVARQGDRPPHTVAVQSHATRPGLILDESMGANSINSTSLRRCPTRTPGNGGFLAGGACAANSSELQIAQSPPGRAGNLFFCRCT